MTADTGKRMPCAECAEHKQRLERALVLANARIAALEVARDAAWRLATWGGRPELRTESVESDDE